MNKAKLKTFTVSEVIVSWIAFFFLDYNCFPIRYVSRTEVRESANKAAANKFSGQTAVCSKRQHKN